MPDVLAFGDSLTAGYGLSAAQAFPAQLQTRLQAVWPAARVINAGVNGDTSAGGLARLPRVLAGLSSRPQLAIVELGANDLLRGIDAKHTRSNLDAILHLLGQAAIPPFIVGLDAPAFLGPAAKRFNAVFPALASIYDAPLFTCSLATIVGNPALTLADRLHPNGKAIGMVVAQMVPQLVEALRRTTAEAA